MKRIIVLFFLSISLLCHSQNDIDYLELTDNSLYMEEANILMETYKGDKLMKYYKIDFYRLKNKMRMEFTEPAVEKGRKMLNDDASLWMYLPKTSKVIKLPMKQSFLGSDASNRDLMKIAFKQDYEIVNFSLLENNIIELELKAKDLSVSYNKVILLFDKNNKVPIQQTIFSLSGKLIKTIFYEKVVNIDSVNTPSVMTIKDEIQQKTLTKMQYSNIKRKTNKTEDYFSLGALKK